MLVEASIALGAATLLALLMMKATLLAIGGNDWTTMQTLTDALLTRETAMANRVPFAEIASGTSMWPDASGGVVGAPVTIQIGKIMGGAPVTAKLIRYRVNQANTSEPDVTLAVWRLHSVVQYNVGSNQYVKSSSTLRAQ
ncbi:hypothetical protein [Roseimicrobium sp. ORNL1]|uniref:hypothetical protein n=1 Tax=Roseimicrobium sp. ORNL1 TaxID=2711231 RepID=UPI0013E1DBAB|nr:hypothetical protein [Roseimicrobium sp. ORNL1]QIF04778.1 hypothetical protein G5S37_25765 [Roseimicrobium sp. ORNL1]